MSAVNFGRYRCHVLKLDIRPFDSNWRNIVCDACRSSRPIIAYQAATVIDPESYPAASPYCLLFIDCEACDKEIGAMWPAYATVPA